MLSFKNTIVNPFSRAVFVQKQIPVIAHQTKNVFGHHQVFLDQFTSQSCAAVAICSMVNLMEAVRLQVALEAIALLVIDAVFCAMRTSWAFSSAEHLCFILNHFLTHTHTQTERQIHTYKCVQGQADIYTDACNNQVIMYSVHGFKHKHTHTCICVHTGEGFRSSCQDHSGWTSQVFGEAEVKGKWCWQAHGQ